MKNLFCEKALNLLFHLTSLNMWVLCYCLFLFCDIKSSNLSFPQTKPVKLKILDITFSSFDCFNGNKIKINFCGKEFKALHNLRKQKHLVIKRLTKTTVFYKYLGHLVLRYLWPSFKFC